MGRLSRLLIGAMNSLRIRVSVTYLVAAGNNVFRSRSGSRQGQIGEASPLGDRVDLVSTGRLVGLERDIQRPATMISGMKRAAPRTFNSISQSRRLQDFVGAVRTYSARNGYRDLHRYIDNYKTRVLCVDFDHPRFIAQQKPTTCFRTLFYHGAAYNYRRLTIRLFGHRYRNICPSKGRAEAFRLFLHASRQQSDDKSELKPTPHGTTR